MRGVEAVGDEYDLLYPISGALYSVPTNILISYCFYTLHHA